MGKEVSLPKAMMCGQEIMDSITNIMSMMDHMEDMTKMITSEMFEDFEITSDHIQLLNLWFTDSGLVEQFRKSPYETLVAFSEKEDVSRKFFQKK